MPSRVEVNEKQIEVDGEKKWLYAAIDTEAKLLLEVDVFSAARLTPRRPLAEKHDVADTAFLVDAGDYLTALTCHDLTSHHDYHDRNHIEN